MACSPTLDSRIRFLVQRQFTNPAAIELLFEAVTRLNVVPTPDNYYAIIFGATLLVQDGEIYWSPEEGWSPDAPDRDKSTWISAKTLCWREVDWLGDKLYYGPKEND